MSFSRCWLSILLLLQPVLASAQVLPSYQTRPGLAGQVRITGSDSMDPLVRLWAQEFQKLQPGVTFQIHSQGSGTAPPALLKDEADLGAMSREMNAAELERFKAKLDRSPLRLTVAYDALAIFVNRRNPLSRIRLDQLDGLYSETRLSGYAWPIRTWKAIGIQRSWGRRPIRAFTRDEKSGTRALFAEKVLKKGGTMRKEIQVADQMGILETVGSDVSALGYGPLTYANPQVRMVPLAQGPGAPATLPTPATIRTGAYPLARHLSLYVDPAKLKGSGEAASSVLQAFLEFVLSKHGQELVSRDGAVSLDAPLALEQIQRLR